MEGGTEAFPELGRHCQHSDCNELDFLPFTCDSCQKVFCLDHRSYKSHECPKSNDKSRKVVVCEICSMSIETTGYAGEDERLMLEKHEKSGNCDPKKKKKPTCPAKRCKEVLTFSNTSTCKVCQVKVCLKHRFPADHACRRHKLSPATVAEDEMAAGNNKFLAAFFVRNGKDCGTKRRSSESPPSSTPIKSY